MPRLARLDAPGVLHHLIGRGIERRKIFYKDFSPQSHRGHGGRVYFSLPGDTGNEKSSIAYRQKKKDLLAADIYGPHLIFFRGVGACQARLVSRRAHRGHREFVIAVEKDGKGNVPDSGRGESCLMLGFSEKIPIHTVCGWRGNRIAIITVYVPKPPKFIDPYTRSKMYEKKKV